MGEYLKECRECGGSDFEVNEFVVYRAVLDATDRVLKTYKTKNNGVDTIVCIGCKKEYSVADFKEVQFES